MMNENVSIERAQVRGRTVGRREAELRMALHRPGMGRKALKVLRVPRRLVIAGPWQRPLTAWVQHRTANPAVQASAHSLIRTDRSGREIASMLERDGVAAGLDVDAAAVEALRAWWAAQGAKRRIDVHREVPIADALMHDPLLLDVARRYLGVEPVLLKSTLTMARPGPGCAESGFHYEISDVRSLILYVYLTDVEDDTAPHEAIRGTHRRKRLSELVFDFQREPTMRRRYGQRITRFTGPRGTAFFEDPATFHRRLPTNSDPRLALLLVWTMRRSDATGSCGHYDIAARPKSAANETRTPAMAA